MTDTADWKNKKKRILDVIYKKLSEKKSILIALDGRCAAGKSTMAGELQKELSCNCIHMDDFFLQPAMRTEKRLMEPGGNVDRERFLSEVLLPLSKGDSFSYRPFLCSTMDFDKPVFVTPNPITIVEGAYACHPDLAKYYDLRIFFTVDKNEQLKRIEKRNGREASLKFIQKWIPLEEKYISCFNIEAECDMVI